MEQHAALLRELRVALLAELGAREMYLRLGRVVKDPELAQVLERLHHDEVGIVERLRGLIGTLGGRPRRRSLRRTWLARGLAWSSAVAGRRLALRICTDAEETRSRWYGHFAEYLLGCRLLEEARLCSELAALKDRHAQILHTWVEHL